MGCVILLSKSPKRCQISFKGFNQWGFINAKTENAADRLKKRGAVGLPFKKEKPERTKKTREKVRPKEKGLAFFMGVSLRDS